MSTWIFSVSSLAGFGCLNALTGRVWNPFCEKQTFAGSFSTRTACCLESRVRAARFMHLVTRRLGRPLLRAIVIQADRFGAQREVILVTPLTGSFIATPDSTFHWNIWDRLLTAPGNSPASSITASPGPVARRSYTIRSLQKESPKGKPSIFSRNAGVRSVKSPRRGLIRLWSFRSMPNYLDIGGLKVPIFSNNSFARQQSSAIFVSLRQANIWRRIRHSKSLSLQSQHGARMGILKFG